MEDRSVRQISPQPESDAVAPFSGFLALPNLVVLGDPGAGKTHLFAHFGQMVNSQYVTARNFLNIPSTAISSSDAIFIDALDEKRAGRGDSNTVDAVISKLFAVRPRQVRISCRIADWLGETDLAAFRAYFDAHGGVVVLSIEPLSEPEQIAVLEGIGVNSPEHFLEEAHARNLSDLLTNPQNLKMLGQVVQNQAWPSSKHELFMRATDLLLSEHNSIHGETNPGRFSADDLARAAGGVCAVRLISDISSVATTSADVADDCPSFRKLTIDSPEIVEAALARRMFVSSATVSTVDYAHRTIAEYLAAKWIAEQVRAGLPLGRVLALIGIEGRPAPELRGLHAWLPVFLPESALVLIDADPFGVLSYGDAASMAPSLRKYLLTSLSELAATDPWFRHGNWSSEAVAALSGADMENEFRAILVNENVPFVLRSIVLDALSMGVPIVALIPDVAAIAVAPGRPYAERESCVEVLIHLGADIADVFHRLSGAPDDVRLRAFVARSCPTITPSDFAAVLTDALKIRNDDHVTGALWNLERRIPVHAAHTILDELKVEDADSGRYDHNSFIDVLHVFDDLLIRVLQGNDKISAEKVTQWLSKRFKLSGGYDPHSTTALKEELSKSSMSAALAEFSIPRWRSDRAGLWEDMFEFQRTTLSSIDPRAQLAVVLVEIECFGGAKRDLLYEIAFYLLGQVRSESSELFEKVYALADRLEDLDTVRNKSCYWEIPDWRWETYSRQEAITRKKEASRQKNKALFERDREQIEAGAHYGWMDYVGRLYYGLFSDVDRDASPLERIGAELGTENALVAFRSFGTFLATCEITPLGEIIRMDAEGKGFNWWYGLLAALEHVVREVDDLNRFPMEFLSSALAIETFRQVFRQRGNTNYRVEPLWKSLLLQMHPEIAVQTYTTIVRNDLAAKADFPRGLDELLNNVQLQSYSVTSSRELLGEFPAASPHALQRLLPTVINETQVGDLSGLVQPALSYCKAINASEAVQYWLAAAFLAGMDGLQPEIDAFTEEDAKAFVWKLYDLSASEKDSGGIKGEVPLVKLEYIIRLVARNFPWHVHPSSWSGTHNPWDASSFLSRLVSLVASRPDVEAQEALMRLHCSKETETYKDEIGHARAQQQIRRIEVQYQQPRWEQVVNTLKNGSPANAADLHALLIDHIEDLRRRIANSNVDTYKHFWNEGKYGRVSTEKSEESARDTLVGILRNSMSPKHIAVDPEGHMAHDKRTDIVALKPPLKAVIELKRDSHPEVWEAMNDQLERLYTRDPDTDGYGIYGVFWYGPKRSRPMKSPPSPLSAPTSAAEMENQLNLLIARDKQAKIRAIVIDVSDGTNENAGHVTTDA